MTTLCGYAINGIPITEIETYETEILQGNPAVKIFDGAIDDNYISANTIANWVIFGSICKKDYKYIRARISEIVITTGWENLSLEEKTIAAKYFAVAVDQRNEIFTIQEQIQYGYTHHVLSTDSRQKRLLIAQTDFFNRISKTNWLELGLIINPLVYNYTQNGREGTSEGDPAGLFDYIDGSARQGTPWSNGGLRDANYEIIGFNSCSEFADHMLNILKHGNY